MNKKIIKMKLFSKIVFLIIVFLNELRAGIVKAEGGVTILNPLGGNVKTFGDLLGKLIDGLMVISVPIVSGMVLVAGFQMLTAGGNPEKFKKGRDTLIYAAVGFAVVLLAKSVHLIIGSIFN